MSYIHDVFGAGGIMAQRFEGYEPRPGQVRMAEAVDLAIDSGTHLVTEAATGVGKSRAALVPAIYHSTHNSKRALVATANIALQEQYVNKDLPALQAELPWPFKFALVKGRSNYLCLSRLEHVEFSEIESEASRPGITCDPYAFCDWCASTETGDVSDAGVVPPMLWALMSVGADRCKGKACKHAQACFANRAKARATDADVVVANYHLLFADMAVRDASEEGTGVLPPVDIVVMDEAHRAGEIARDFIGDTVTESALRRLGTDALRTMHEASLTLEDEGPFIKLEEAAGDLFADLLTLRRSKDYHVRLRAEGTFDVEPTSVALAKVAHELGGISKDDRLTGGQRMMMRKIRDRANKHRAALLDAHALADPNCVYFIEERKAGKHARASLCSMPVDVSATLREGLFEKRSTVVCMSATLAVGGSFKHFCAGVGADGAPSLVVDSPFDLSTQALLVVPAGLPDPRESAYRTAVPEFVSKTIAQAQGRTLALFTTWKNLQATAEKLRSDGTSSKYKILVQGDAPRTMLVDHFRSDVSSVLLGTASFWEGVDVPGEALSCVVIDRLPFATPDDPVLDVITERDPRGWFSKWSMPKAIIAFRQGFGRLIRSTRDRGVVVCLDRRLVDKSYGRTFVKALGPVRLARDIEDVGRFFQTQGVLL